MPDQKIETLEQEGVETEVIEPRSPEDLATDTFYIYMNEELRKYRIVALVFGIIGFSMLLASVALFQAGILQIKFYGLASSIAYLFIVLMGVVIFTRTRPFKRRIKEYSGQPLHTIIDPDAPDGVRIEEREVMDLDEMYKILERDIRTELIPETDEYHKLRNKWIALFVAAGIIAVASLLLYYFVPSAGVLSTIIFLVAFALVIVAFYIDRTQMKPMRNAWAKAHGGSEFYVRNHMND